MTPGRRTGPLMADRHRNSLRPETLRQARLWEEVKRKYVRAGLCDRCAAQAAWAHQSGAGGWDRIHPPCWICRDLVAFLPYTTSNPLWRAVLRKRL